MSETDTTSGDDPAVPAANPLLGALLGSLGGGGAIDPMSLLMSQLGGQAASDPRMALFNQFLSQRREAPQIDGQAEPAAAEPARGSPARQERAHRIRTLRALARSMFAELEILRERNDTLAAALGACHICFGSDPMCSECAGRGIPGSADPDPTAFGTYVMPAVHRERWLLRERERRAKRYLDPRNEVALGDISGRPLGRPATNEAGRATL